jgi:hypothetical protein
MPSAGTPHTRATDSGTFSARPVTWISITALGRDTAVLKPRYTVNMSDAGSEKASTSR